MKIKLSIYLSIYGNELEIRDPNTQDNVYGVCGTKHDIIGFVNLPIDMNGLFIYHDFAIFHKLHVPLILGLDFLQESDAVIDVVSHTITCQGLTQLPFIAYLDGATQHIH